MKKAITISILILFPFFCFGQWVQLGTDIDGLTANEQSGTITSLSADGTILAISAPRAMDGGVMKGKVRVYEWNDASWIQKGSDLVGTNQGDLFGDSISISSDGNILVVGAPGFLNPSSPPGYTKIFEWNGSNWIQKGTDIIGENSADSSGTAVSLSSNGNILAIGAGSNDGVNGSDSGHCRVYEWNGTAWSQRGSDIDGEAMNDFFGNAVSLNDAGDILAIGAAGNDGNGTTSGHVRIYEWNGAIWTQKGNDIDGDVVVSSFGSSLSIDAAGTTFIASGFSGSNGSIGSIKIFTWNGTSWIQKGININGENGSDFFGTSVSINEDGSTIIAGTTGAGVFSGYAKIFKFIGNLWIQQGSNLIGEVNGDQFGRSTSISNDGSIVAIGTPFNDGNGTSAGHVRVFENTTLSNSDFDSNPFSFYPNPAKDIVNFSSTTAIESIIIYNLVGQEVLYKQVNSNKFNLNLSNLSNGTYIGKLNSNGISQSVKLFKI